MVRPPSTEARRRRRRKRRREEGRRYCCCGSNSSPCLRRSTSDCWSPTGLMKRKPAREKMREERPSAADPPQEGAPRPGRRQVSAKFVGLLRFFSIFRVCINIILISRTSHETGQLRKTFISLFICTIQFHLCVCKSAACGCLIIHHSFY